MYVIDDELTRVSH